MTAGLKWDEEVHYENGEENSEIKMSRKCRPNRVYCKPAR